MARPALIAPREVDPDLYMLPAFVIGYEGVRTVPSDAPPWLHVVQHQHGGLCCYHWSATGCVLPLQVNQREGTGKLWLLTRALMELGESWPPDSVYRAPEVRELVGAIADLVGGWTDQPMTPSRVEALGELLAQHLAFPGLTPPVAEAGFEALIRFRETDPSPFFDGWRAVTACPREPDDEPAWRVCARYGRELARELEDLVGRGERPRIFLLWENSD